MEAYVQSLNEFVYQSGIVTKPVFLAGKAVPRRSACSTRKARTSACCVRGAAVVDENLAAPGSSSAARR